MISKRGLIRKSKVSTLDTEKISNQIKEFSALSKESRELLNWILITGRSISISTTGIFNLRINPLSLHFSFPLRRIKIKLICILKNIEISIDLDIRKARVVSSDIEKSLPGFEGKGWDH